MDLMNKRLGHPLIRRRERSKREGGENIGESRDHAEEFPMAILQEAFHHGMIEKANKMVEIAVVVKQDNRLFVAANLAPGQHFAEFVESSEAAGHGDESVRKRGHQRLALVHGADDPQILQSAMSRFLFDQQFRDDAGNVPTLEEHGVGQLSHHAEMAAAIDEAKAVRGDLLA